MPKKKKKHTYCRYCGEGNPKYGHFMTQPRYLIDGQGNVTPQAPVVHCLNTWSKKEGLKKFAPITTKRIISNNKVTQNDITEWESLLPNLFPKWTGNC